MDIFQHFLLHQSENTSAFSDVFRTAKEFHQLLGRKSYLLDHYLSMFFRLIIQTDFCLLEEKIYQAVSKLQKKILVDLENNNGSIPMFDCQEPFTQQELSWTALADTLLEQALTDFQNQTVSTYQGTVDLVDLEQTKKNRSTSGQRRMGTVPADTEPMFSFLFLAAVVLARFYH